MISETTLAELLANSARFSDLSVSLVAEAVPFARVDCRPDVFRKRLVRAAFLPVVDRKRVLLGMARFDMALEIPEDGPVDWLQTQLKTAPEQFSRIFVPESATVSTVKQYFAQSEAALMPIVDAKGRYTGRCASLSLLQKLEAGTLRPPRVGGLATPLGVYMTSGYYCAGAGVWGLVATGVLFGMLVHGLDMLSLLAFSAIGAVLPAVNQLAQPEQLVLQGGLMLVWMLTLLRLSPIAGLHAAEHMTINALERDLALTEPIIRTQPREHVRCGTNLMVLLMGVQTMGVSLYFAWGRMNWVGLILYTTGWFFLIFKFWKPAGLWLQRHFTTKTPTSSQLASGIKAGEELLAKFNRQPHGMPPLWRRLWGSGLAQMAVSFLLTVKLTGWLLQQLGWQ